MVIIKCKNCGKEIRTFPSQNRKYCSKDCYYSHRDYSDIRGKNNSSWKGGKVKKECNRCRKAFYVSPYRVESQKHCSLVCANRSMAEKQRGTSMPQKGSKGPKNGSWNGGKRIDKCIQCKDVFKVALSRYGRRKFCSISCARKFQFTGKGNPNWLGGISFEPYGLEFNKELKAVIRKRDNNKCKLCGKRKYKIELDVHHIDYDKRNNDPANLISLCKHPCHRKTNSNRKQWIVYFKNYLGEKIIGDNEVATMNKLDIRR